MPPDWIHPASHFNTSPCFPCELLWIDTPWNPFCSCLCAGCVLAEAKGWSQRWPGDPRGLLWVCWRSQLWHSEAGVSPRVCLLMLRSCVLCTTWTLGDSGAYNTKFLLFGEAVPFPRPSSCCGAPCISAFSFVSRGLSIPVFQQGEYLLHPWVLECLKGFLVLVGLKTLNFFIIGFSLSSSAWSLYSDHASWPCSAVSIWWSKCRLNRKQIISCFPGRWLFREWSLMVYQVFKK